ncbi:MAG: ATP-binding cassette domain-containing protein [Propionibacteriaceae bacterium]|nr:ATP-binding cassette domain-containing protein [Propionibacteriaceae bacterium]
MPEQPGTSVTQNSSSVAIAVRDLTKSFGPVHVLDKVSFEVAAGSIFALLGENGAGKTTTIKILATLLKPDSGTAEVNGFDVVTQAGQVRRSISLTGQFTAVDEILTGRENMRMIARLRHLTDWRQVADGLLARFGLTDAADRRVGTYSGGMQRRLDLAMSLIGTPPVIFLDEPTTGLDPQGRLDMWHTITDLSDQGTTVFLTTQYLDEAEHLADHVAILHQGTIIAHDTVENLKRLFPATTTELVEKQPSLEEIFLHIIAGEEKK